MIYFTTFILTLLLSHIARAVPACGDAASPKDLYDSTYDDVQQPLLASYKVTWSDKYDNGGGHTNTLTCSNLAPMYPKFVNIPHFPYIGAGFNVTHIGNRCQQCWVLSYLGRSIRLSAVDHVANEKGFVISHKAFIVLNGGVGTVLYAEGVEVALSLCGLP